MRSLLNIFSSVAIPLFLGLGVISISFKNSRRMDFLEIAPISLGVGIGIISIWGFLLLNLGLSFSVLTAALLLLVAVPLILLARSAIAKGKEENFVSRVSRVHPKRIEFLIWGCIFFEIAYVFWLSSILPLHVDDAISMWGARAKIIYFAERFADPFSETLSALRDIVQPDYPLLVPFSQSWVCIALGQWNDVLCKMVSPAFFLLLTLSFYSILKKLIPRNNALLFTFLLCGLPFLRMQATWGTADMAFTFYYAIGFLYMYLWMNRPEGGYLILSALLLGFGMWTKAEGIPSMLISSLILIVFVVANRRFLTKEQLKAVRNFFMISIFFFAVIIYFRFLMGWKNYMVSLKSFSPSYIMTKLNRIPLILYEFQKQFFGAPKKWNLLGYLFIFSVVFDIKKVFRPPLLYIIIAIMLNFMLYIWVYLVANMEIHFLLGTSQNRVLMHFIPFMIFISGLLLASSKKI